MSSELLPPRRTGLRKFAFLLGFLLVLTGLLNTMPAFPGLDGWITASFGDGVAIRRFPYEYLFPIVFVVMMTIVAIENSFARDFRENGKSDVQVVYGLCMDAALVVTAILVALAYLIEIDSVCLIDQFTGERAELIARALQEEIEFAETMGLPPPNSVDDPSCINTLDIWIFPLMACAIGVFLRYNVKVWGFPLVAVAILIASYTLVTVLIWYFLGADDINKYLVTKLGGEPRQLIDGRPNMQDILVNNAQGLLGRFMGILMNTVFPYIVLGSLFGVSAGGRSLIKIAFLWTRRLRGGPAHAAIVSSALFGTPRRCKPAVEIIATVQSFSALGVIQGAGATGCISLARIRMCSASTSLRSDKRTIGANPKVENRLADHKSIDAINSM